MSYISHRHGLGIDTVTAFEMVLPNGTIARVTEETPELFRVMKGSGLSNFGIVTSFEVEVIEAPRDGYRLSFTTHGWDQAPAIVDALHAHLVEQDTEDVDAMVLPLFTYNQEMDLPLVLVLQVHSNHSSITTTPSVFQPFTGLPTLAPEQPQLLTYAETLQLGIDLGPPHGRRADYAVSAFRPSKVALLEIVEVVRVYFDKIKHVNGMYVNVITTPMYDSMIKQMSKHGGNSLCVDENEGPFWMFSIAANWFDAADDDFMSGLIQQTVQRVDAATKKHGVFHPYKYFNYAAPWQAADVWAGYSAADLKQLRRLQRQYDPEQIFVSGGLHGAGFKLNTKEDAPQGKDEL